MAIYITNIF